MKRPAAAIELAGPSVQAAEIRGTCEAARIGALSLTALILLDEGGRILRLYYSTFDDRLPHQYIDEHEEIIAAIEAGDADRADRLAIAHAGQIVRQIQDYIARDLDRPVAISLS